MRQHLLECIPFVFGDRFQQMGRDLHLQFFFPHRVGKSAQRVGVAVGKGKVGLDIQNWRSVTEISTLDQQDRSFFCLFNSSQSDR